MSNSDFLEKIAVGQEAVSRLSTLPKPVVFTNGVFDVLHRGHVTYLAQSYGVSSILSFLDVPKPK